ncbi:EPIDERMAL PATTERNING FACTOR-like protein 6 [Syzygium oleosum]|uniref:EPIDERMAL PATTERNING FACTOR-like protein 6 n=1 Tax=Syzygium oleosum TaxID=219896 RepID=UPI0024B907C8|nr:EPIDERMAL PATTERNING FACTOR-like protein 6 [Syzygium oleosum]
MTKPVMIRYCLLVAALQIVGVVSMTSTPSSLFVAAHKQEARPHLSRATLNIKQGASVEKVGEIGDEKCRGLSRLGSRPPNCEHKCRGCEPCEAIQIPATTDRASVQYANYEPEGWKCKCGSSFFDP